ncbi:uncharacterized protein LOC112521551 [Cynara cardunculus var. scolymus]|uniref:Uncharacterized protein n=1 Tax=Cynara cardunculus var. scolymus TaxID=59895 RepID=A0A103XGH6_CYNCS|nr:uncharacterized protein LOC112521551 [Cynara cardunculus var. scolymus]KVH90233.1 hypothetical protein Ccrd_007827 [Cynara cardunculus var. scolymus]
MFNSGCTAVGSLNDSKFNDPMPWIGIYVAAASLFAAMAMAIDSVHGFRYKKFWFPCKFFTLNATTLTVIAIAIKFSVDLNAAMPRRQDQLAKVSSSAFICMVMGNLLPSLGTMEDTELLMNIVALGILVITAITNICIQMGTGVIFEFWIEHVLIMLLMLILLAILCSLSLAIPTTKYYLDITYERKLKKANKVCFLQRNLPVAERLRQDLGKYWMMAHTSSPQFVIGRSAPCSASGAFCLFNTLILAESILRPRIMPWSFRFCTGESDYKWSTTLVLISQTVAVGVGTISPAFRWFMTINFRCPTKASRACNREFVIERYWTKRLLFWQVQPLGLRIRNRRWRKLAHGVKFQMFRFFIWMQKGLVFCCKMIRFVSIFFVSRFLRLKKFVNRDNSVSSNDSEMELQHNPNMSLRRYVIYLEGEEGLVDLMTENNCDATAHWIRMGEKEKPRNLIKLLDQLDSLSSFTGVQDFNSDKIPSLSSNEPPNCWALPIVTLTSIAIAIPNIDEKLIEQLVCGVDEGLKYVNEIENHLDKKDLKHVRKTAEIVWSGVELYNKWLDVDLCKLANQESETEPEIIKLLAEISKEKFMEFANKDMMFMDECLKEAPSRWPIKVLAANSMYRICKTLLLAPHETNERLFEKISLMICNILAAAFTNLQRVISSKCHQSRIEERDQSIRSAVLLFGKTKKILEILDRKGPEGSDHGQLVHIDDWHLVSKQMDSLHSLSSSSTDQETAASSPSDLCISVE